MVEVFNKRNDSEGWNESCRIKSIAPKQLKSFSKRKVGDEMELFELLAQCRVCVTRITIK